MPASSEFQRLSESVAAKFLQTVVVVDDQPIYRRNTPNTPTVVKPPKMRKPTSSKNLVEQPSSSESTENEISGEIILVDTQADLEASNIMPTQELPKQDVISTPLNGENEAITTSTTTDSVHELNVHELISLFAEKGLVCSVLSPEEEDPGKISQKVITVARNADLVILDWVLYKSIGDTTIQIIQGIIDSDEEHDGRLRTIVIYTGESDIHAIAKKINAAIGGHLNTDGDECVVEKNGTVRIAVFTKDHTKIPQQYINRKVSLQELPDKLIAEFSKITSGLVPNVALDSLATLRANTHLLLAKLNSNIDIPFLTHRALLPRPDDSAEHLVDLIASEIRSLLDEYEVEKNATLDAVRFWLESSTRTTSTYSLGSLKIDGEITVENVLELLQGGIENWTITGLTKSKKKEIFQHISKMLCLDEIEARRLDDEFAMLTSLARQSFGYGSKDTFKLTLGTILEQSSPNNLGELRFWLCIQPRCNSTRIIGERFFPLLPLEIVNDDSKFSLVVKNSEGDTIRLKLLDEAHHVSMVSFPSDQNRGGAVIAQAENGSPIETELPVPRTNKKFFFSSSDGTKYRWVAELKRDHAQRIANNFASNLSRVGLNESEWLRRWSSWSK